MLDTKQIISDLPPASFSDLKPARRLVVLIPPFDINLSAFAHRVWELANATGSHILLLGKFDEAQKESKLRRDVATLSAMLKNESILVESNFSFGRDWIHLIRNHLHKGDVLVRVAEHKINYLESQIDSQIYILSDLVSQKDSNSNLFSQLTSVAGSLAIIVGFFMLQVRIIDLTKDGVRTLFLLISLPIGFGLLWAWNSLFG
ncbi:MAG: hypothetical protein JNK81_02710 [Anaerolineales bacterium]|nr:hypothetical protein [Anaerolineales bacterium]